MIISQYVYCGLGQTTGLNNNVAVVTSLRGGRLVTVTLRRPRASRTCEVSLATGLVLEALARGKEWVVADCAVSPLAGGYKICSVLADSPGAKEVLAGRLFLSDVVTKIDGTSLIGRKGTAAAVLRVNKFGKVEQSITMVVWRLKQV